MPVALYIGQGLTEPVLVAGVRVVNEEEEEEEEEEEVCTYEVRLTVNEIIWTRSSVRSCQLLCMSARVCRSLFLSLVLGLSMRKEEEEVHLK